MIKTGRSGVLPYSTGTPQREKDDKYALGKQAQWASRRRQRGYWEQLQRARDLTIVGRLRMQQSTVPLGDYPPQHLSNRYSA